jgi:hypothetical protein
VERNVEVDSVPVRVLRSISRVQGIVDCFGEEGAQFVGFVAAGKKMAVETEGFTADIKSVCTELVDAVNHAENKAGQDSRGVGRMRGNIKVEIHCFFKQGGADAVSDDADGEIHKVDGGGAGTEGPLETSKRSFMSRW